MNNISKQSSLTGMGRAGATTVNPAADEQTPQQNYVDAVATNSYNDAIQQGYTDAQAGDIVQAVSTAGNLAIAQDEHPATYVSAAVELISSGASPQATQEVINAANTAAIAAESAGLSKADTFQAVVDQVKENIAALPEIVESVKADTQALVQQVNNPAHPVVPSDSWIPGISNKTLYIVGGSAVGITAVGLILRSIFKKKKKE